MPRASREQMSKNRAAVVEAAAQLLCSEGVGGITLDAVSARVGITHGGFYKQFESKEALLAESLDFAVLTRHGVLRDWGSKSRSATEFADWYLAGAHRDLQEHACPVVALSQDVTRDPGGPLAEGYHRALEDLIDTIQAASGEGDRSRSLAAVAMLVGALQLARATQGSAVSDELLAAATFAIEAI